MDTNHEKLATALGTLRACGFFESYGTLPNTEVAAALLEDLRQRCAHDSFYQTNPYYRPDQGLLRRFSATPDANDYKWLAAQDQLRVWTGDLEADVCASNLVYERVTQEYAQLSMGLLQPTNLSEIWQSEQGPITLSFDSRGQHFSTELPYYDDWIAGEVFSFLDDAMCNQGFTGAIHSEVNTGQDVFLVRATQEEKDLMERLLGWSFDWRALMEDLNTTE